MSITQTGLFTGPRCLRRVLFPFSAPAACEQPSARSGNQRPAPPAGRNWAASTPAKHATPLRSVACFAYVPSAQFRNLLPPSFQIIIDPAPMRYYIFPAPSHHSLV